MRLRVGSAQGGRTWWSSWEPLSGKKQLVIDVEAGNLGSGIQELLIQEEGKTPTVTSFPWSSTGGSSGSPSSSPRGAASNFREWLTKPKE